MTDSTPAIAGAARSEREIAEYLSTQAACPTCGHRALGPYRIDRTSGSIAAVAYANCALCSALVEVGFTAGPGWEHPPADLLHLASGEAPSTLLTESYFREEVERLGRRLSDLDPARRAGIVAVAGEAIRDLLELAKFRRHDGRELWAAELDLLVRFAKSYVVAGKPLPEDVARLLPT